MNLFGNLARKLQKLNKTIDNNLSRSNDKRINSAFVFIAKFLLLSIPLYFFIFFNLQINQLISLTDMLSRFLLSVLGMEHGVLNNLITLPVENGTWAGFINWDCTGWKSMYAFFALVFASPFALRKKLFAMLLVPVIYAINLLRIWFMFYIASTNLAVFPLVHAVVWSWGLVAVVLAFWLAWMKFTSHR